MPKSTKPPVPYENLTPGHWYQCRFEFDDGPSWTPIEEFSPAHSSTTPSPSHTRCVSSISSRTSSPSLTRTQPWNKSHRILLLGKYEAAGPRPFQRAVCLFLTSFGMSLNPRSICEGNDYLRYIPVNATPPVPIYRNIPVSVENLYGFLNFVEEMSLPVCGVGASRDELIYRMPEGVRKDDVVEVSSPEWALTYIRKLKVAWVEHFVGGLDEDKWAAAATTIQNEFAVSDTAKEMSDDSLTVSSHKRVRQEDTENTTDREGVELKRRRPVNMCLGGANDEEQNFAVDPNDDSGICIERIDEASSGEQELIAGDLEVLPATDPNRAVRLLSCGLYHLDPSDDIYEQVDFGLLHALFRLRPYA